MDKKAYIFDLDGTLVDTLSSLEISVNRMMDRLSLKHVTKEQCRTFIGNGARVLVEKSLRAVSGENTQAYVDEALGIYQEEFASFCTYEVKPYEGIETLLKTLKSKGCILAVLTNKPHAQAIVTVESIFGKGVFDFIQGQVDGMPRKPDPKSIDYVLEKLSLVKEECVFVGDSEVDIRTGKSANVYTIGVVWGFRDEEVLKNEKADVIVSKPLQLLQTV